TGRSFFNSEDVLFAEDLELLALDLDLGAGVLAVVDDVAGLDGEGDALAVLELSARSDGDHLALVRLLLRGVGKDDSPRSLLFGRERAHDHPVAQWLQLH